MEILKDHKHNIVYILLIIIIVLLLGRGKQGRYSLSSAGDGTMTYVLDTKTSQLWVRSPANVNMYLGTNENPKRERIELASSDKSEQKE